jgi:uncharacterized protein (TIGR02246 family)
MSQHVHRTFLFLLLVTASGGPAAAANPALDRSQDAESIRAASRSYVEALEKQDGAALARLWTPDGDIVDDLGRTMPGRDTVAVIEPTATAPDGPPIAKPAMRVTETRLRFLSPDVAIEDGSVEVADAGGRGPLRGRYSATWVRHDGAWKLSALRESKIDAVAGMESLADLDWMVGDWEVIDDPDWQQPADTAPAQRRPSIEMRVKWNANRTFLLRDMRITPADADAEADAIHVSQRIGWDPLSRSIHSWVFGSDGSHGEAEWSRDDGSWVARTTAVHPDGRQTSSINIYTFDGKDRCTWRSLPTHVGGEHEPQVTLTMIRKTTSTKADRNETDRRGQQP